MLMSTVESEGRVVPLIECAGVGRAVVKEVMVLCAPDTRSELLGENCDGLCGV